MKAHIVNDGVIVNTVVVESLDALPNLVASVSDEGIGWLWDGESFSEPPAPQKTPEQLIAEVTSATQKRLDDFARTRNYDGILSAASYAVSSHPPFANEGRYCADMRDATWGALYTIMADVQAGTRPMPSSYADIEPLLPELVWPT